MSITIKTKVSNMDKVRSTNATDTSFPSRVPTTTQPSGEGVYDAANGAAETGNILKIIPFGVGSNDQTFDMRVIGWSKVGTGVGSGIWIPVILSQVSCTLSSACPGVASTTVDNTNLFCDTITALTALNTLTSVEVVSPANDFPGFLAVDYRGFKLIEIVFDMTGATSGNALVGTY